LRYRKRMHSRGRFRARAESLEPVSGQFPQQSFGHDAAC